MKNQKTIYLTTGAMIAALYVACCFIFSPISYGAVQVRIAEALTILPIFTPAAIPGLFIGCIIANLMGGCVIVDVVFGSIATLIGAFGTYYIGKKSKWLSPIAPIVSNTLIVPFVLKYAYGVDLPIVIIMASIAAGEIVGCGVLGIILGKALSKAGVNIVSMSNGTI